MYIYTNILETENHIYSQEKIVNNEKVKWAERARVAEVIFKNDTTLRPKEL